jgi:signal transduction histidine kinase/ActR/RegA family two-component response regulator
LISRLGNQGDLFVRRSKREQELESEVRQLQAEIVELQKRLPWPVTGETVRVPEPFKPLFDVAQETVHKYFSQAKTDPSKATIEISGERYVLLRASSLSVDFLMTIKNLYSDYGEDKAFAIGRNFLFDISHVIGMEDAKSFHRNMGVTDPIAKLSAGPIHFAYSGWAFVDIRPESTPHPNEDYFLTYDHPYSFEADSWIKAGQRSEYPVCIMNSGYSSGWCEESFGMPLTAVELTCKAAGDDKCTFIMAPPHRIEEHLGRIQSPKSSRASLRIPSFFERKRVEEEMTAARQKAEASDRMKSEFLANMSHEIRTPMNGVIGMTKLVLETELTKSQRDYLSAARDSAESLMAIINQVLDFSKIEAGAIVLDPQPFELRRAFGETMKPFLLRGESKGVEVDWNVAEDIPDRLIGDEGRLRQVIVNLVGNAIKFTNQGRVDVDVVLEEQDQDNNHLILHFRVSDTGVGIPSDNLESVFDAFTQVDMSTTRRYGGTGLGLTISNELVRLMSGRIWCENNEPSGSAFHFVAEFELDGDATTDDQAQDSAAAPEAVALANRQETDQAPALKILLAEDSRVNQMLAIAMLERWGHTVTIASNGKEAVEIWQASPTDFDLILMDVLMPELDGLDATVAIRKIEQGTGRHIPIIAVTAQAMKGDREVCLNAGMDDYISKPIRKDELQQLIYRFIK